jgi:hypothetical protein
MLGLVLDTTILTVRTVAALKDLLGYEGRSQCFDWAITLSGSNGGAAS